MLKFCILETFFTQEEHNKTCKAHEKFIPINIDINFFCTF
jgi:hypothetical protein